LGRCNAGELCTALCYGSSIFVGSASSIGLKRSSSTISKSKEQTMAEEKKQNKQVNIELPEELAEGTYANLAIIGHSQSEFVVDFVRMVPNVPKAKVKSRVILTPQHAKRLAKALVENIRKYEAQHGKIAEQAQQEQQFPLNFTPTAQA